jgi:hypothetical protein
MQAVLIILGALGCGAVLISIYVFTVAARRYVHERGDQPHVADIKQLRSETALTAQSMEQPEGERRRKRVNSFPLTLPSGEIVFADRRRRDRRRTAL